MIISGIVIYLRGNKSSGGARGAIVLIPSRILTLLLDDELELLELELELDLEVDVDLGLGVLTFTFSIGFGGISSIFSCGS